MDALDWLESQHRDINGLFETVATAVNAGKRTALAARLVQAVDAHSRIEERIFYGAFRAQVERDSARLYQGFEEHALLRFAADKLLRTRATDLRFATRLGMLAELFQRHALAEEDWMFPKAKRALSDEALDRIGTELERAHAMRAAVVPHVVPSTWRTAAPSRKRTADPRRKGLLGMLNGRA